MFYDYLLPFQEKFLNVQKEFVPTLHYVVLDYFNILKNNQPNKDDSKILQYLKNEIIMQTKEKITLNNYHWAALFLHPIFKSFLLLNTVSERKQKVREIKKFLIFLSAARHDNIDNSKQNKDVAKEQQKPESVQIAKSLSSYSEFTEYKNSPEKESILQLKEKSITKEIDIYLNCNFKLTISQQENPLLFWSEKTEEFPVLSHIAEMIYVIPASNSISERAFSLCGNILGKKKSNMKPETLDQLIRFRKKLLNQIEIERKSLISEKGMEVEHIKKLKLS